MHKIRTKDKHIMELEIVLINQIRSRTDTTGEDNFYDDRHYLLKKIEIFPREYILDLLRLHAIYVVKAGRKTGKQRYELVAGARIFHIAAFCLAPDEKIPVVVLKSPVKEEEVRNLSYLDLVVTPLLLSQDGSAANIYQRLTSYEKREELSPLFSSQRAFAKAVDVSPSALCNGKNGKKKNHSCDTGHSEISEEPGT